MPNLKDKVAIITGASSGIGAATAEYFASLGATLSLTGRNVEKLELTRKKCIEAGLKETQVLATPCDVTKREDLEKLIDATIKKFNKLDILVNCAGIIVKGGVTTAPIESYDQVMDVNVRSMILICKIASPHLIATKGAIVNVSSINGPCSFAAVTYYCISKAAVDQLTKCFALELAPSGVRVNAVNPGVIITEIHTRGGMSESEYVQFVERSKTTHALGRPGEPIEVAKSIAFLASDDASFTTGELLRIDGGRGLMVPR